MRRHTIRLVASCARIALLGMCGAAAGTAAIWTWRGEWVDAVDDALVASRVRSYAERVTALAATADVAQRERGYRSLVGELDWVRRQDYLADVLRDSYSALATLEEQRGNDAAAYAWMFQWVRFDEQDVMAATRLAELECAWPDYRQAGLDRLTALSRRYPGHPVVVRALAKGLITSGRWLDSCRALEDGALALRSKLWTIGWDVGGGIDLAARRVDTVPVREGDESTFRFRVAEPIVGMHLQMPTFHSALLQRPRIEVAGGRVIDLIEAQQQISEVCIDRGVAITNGGGGPYLVARWDPPIPADTALAIRWCEVPIYELAYASALIDPALAAIYQPNATADPADLALLERTRMRRARAATSGQWQVFWCLQGGQFGDAQSRIETLVPIPDATGCTYSRTFAIGGAADVLRLDFPEAAGVTYTFAQFDVQLAGRTLPIDMAAVPLLAPHNLERRGDAFVITGPDPYFSFALPERLDVVALKMAGTAR